MNSEVLVLNQDYEPLNVASLPRAFRLVLGGKAEILAEGDPIRSASRSWTAPSVVRLRHRVRRPRPRAKLSRKEIFARDGHACQYCGRTGVSLTIDHIVPKSRGGDTWTWENLVTACMACNHRKGDRLPEAAGLQLRRKPYEPRCDVYAVSCRTCDTTPTRPGATSSSSLIAPRPAARDPRGGGARRHPSRRC